MPLNIENKQYVSVEEEAAPQPFLHQPKKQYHPIKYILLGVFIIVVTSSSIFLLYLFYLNLYTPTISVEATTPTPDSEQIDNIAEQKPIGETQTEQTSHSADQTKTTPQPPVAFTSDSRYTIYISVYTNEKIASEEVARWNEAGFVAAVVHVNDNFRVSLGRYKSATEARNFAVQWSDAFEYGYWIGTIE